MIFYSKIKFILVAFLLILFAFFSFDKVLAYNFQDNSGIKATNEEAGYSEAGLSDNSLPQLIGEIINTILSFIGVFFLLLTLYAGFVWMFSRGNEQDIEQAKKTLQNAIIGLIVVLLAYTVTYFIIEVFFSVEMPIEE